MIEAALVAGFTAVGMDVILVGPMPTPAVAMLTRSLRADLGVMISASHNPFADNGIKLFGPDGYKLSDETEASIEALLEASARLQLAAPERLGRAQRLDDVHGRYVEFAKSTLPKGLRLDGRKIVIDCANGAAYKVAPAVLWELGADVVSMGVKPDGFNINRDSGSTATEAMCRAVVEHRADLGIALDGDADRVILADEGGHVVDGDQLIALVTGEWARAGSLRGGGAVATVMSNFGLERHLAGLGLVLARTQVGDRYVVEHMREGGYNIGGEQSGHLILSDFTTTGDGLIAALQVLAVLVQHDRPTSEVCHRFEPLPQVLVNVPTALGQSSDSPAVGRAIAEAEARLGKEGRVLVRRSGTQPLVRVMVEGEDEAVIRALAEDIAQAIKANSGS
jgi:phosphoglucosamine mutase